MTWSGYEREIGSSATGFIYRLRTDIYNKRLKILDIGHGFR